MSRPDRRPHVVVCNDTKLIYSDDYLNGWVNGFREIGCDVTVVDISAFRPLVSYGVSRRSPMSMKRLLSPKLLAESIAKKDPDLVWFHHGRVGSISELQTNLRERGIKTAVYLCDEPYESGETAIYASRYGYVFTMDPCTVQLHSLQHGRKDVFYMPPAADTSVLKNEVPHEERTIPAYFLGNGNLIPRRDYLKPIQRLVPEAKINYFGQVKKGSKEWVSVSDWNRVFNQVRVGLNVHRRPDMTLECHRTRIKNRERYVGKPRLHTEISSWVPSEKTQGTGFWNDFNLPASHWCPRLVNMGACGVCVINDGHRSEVQREFDFLPQADDPAHFAELVLYYINHPKEAEEIGCALATRIGRLHTYRHRAAEILIRTGLEGMLPDETYSSLGARQEWLTPQDLRLLGEKSPLGRTGRSATWSPVSGSALTAMSMNPSVRSSLDPVNKLSQW